jgi:hypothetical protein
MLSRLRLVSAPNRTNRNDPILIVLRSCIENVAFVSSRRLMMRNTMLAVLRFRPRQPQRWPAARQRRLTTIAIASRVRASAFQATVPTATMRSAWPQPRDAGFTATSIRGRHMEGSRGERGPTGTTERLRSPLSRSWAGILGTYVPWFAGTSFG